MRRAHGSKPNITNCSCVNFARVIMAAVEEQGVDLPDRTQWAPQKARLRTLAWIIAKE